MNRISRVAPAALALGLLLGVIAAPTVATAHTPAISGSCSGVKLKASNYDGAKANVWEFRIDDVIVDSGTFGASLDKIIPVPQEAATTAWSATIRAEDGSYAQTKGGNVGPCGKTTVNLPTLGATPATCDAPGALAPDFTAWPAAQNANGYEGDGFRVYISPAYTGSGTYTATLQKIGAGFDPRYPNGTTVVGETTQTITVDPIKPDAECAGDQPDNLVTYGKWSKGEHKCGDTTVAIEREVVTTSYKLEGREWILDTETAVRTVQTDTREPNADELKACEPPALLPAAVTASVVEFSCVDGTFVGNEIVVAYENATLAVTLNGEPYTGSLTGLGMGAFVLTFTAVEGYEIIGQSVFPFDLVQPTEGCLTPCELDESACNPGVCDPTTIDGECREVVVNPPASLVVTGTSEDFINGGLGLIALLVPVGVFLMWRAARRHGITV